MTLFKFFSLAFADSNSGLDDQTVFWTQIRNSSIPTIVPMLTCDHYNGTESGSDLIACPLDGCMFSAGGLRGVAYNMIRDYLKE